MCRSRTGSALSTCVVQYYGPHRPAVLLAGLRRGGVTRPRQLEEVLSRSFADRRGRHRLLRDRLRAGDHLDAIVAIADDASPPKPFGIWDLGNSTGTTSPRKPRYRPTSATSSR